MLIEIDMTTNTCNSKNSDLIQDQNGFAQGSLPTVTGKQSDVRQLLGDNVENNKGDAQQKKERSNCKKVKFPCLACVVVAAPTQRMLLKVSSFKWSDNPIKRIVKKHSCIY